MGYKRISAIDIDTGEVYGNALLGENEKVILKTENEKQMDAFKRKNKEIEEIKEFIQCNEGAFLHLIYRYNEPILKMLQSKMEGNKSNIHIVRFMVLASYTTFGGKLFDNNRNRIKHSNLLKIWDTTSRNSMDKTYKLLVECNYIYEENGYLMINEDIIIKGAMEGFDKLKKDDRDITYTRIFAKNIQDMYYSTEPRQRKQLAHLFKLLPYVNHVHNVVCENPRETNHTKLKMLNWTEVAKICGEDENNVTRFKNTMLKLKVYNRPVIGQFTSGDSQHGYKICVNPKVYYAGANIEDLKALYRLFEMGN